MKPMTLSKRYARSVRANLGFYVSIVILTLLTLELFYLFYIAGTGINAFGEAFFESQSLEDAHFTTYLEIPEDELDTLQTDYNVTLEAQLSIDITEDGTTARVFAPNEQINLYDVTAGSDLADKYDMLISEGYATNMGVELGDEITLGGLTFTVVGYFQRPDYLYMLESEGDSYKNITTFYLAYVCGDALEELGTASVTYLVQYGEDNSDEFRVAINDAYMTKSYLATSENMRVQMVPQQADMFIVASYLILVLMPLVAMVLICIMIGRKIKDEQRILGTLTAYGYTRGQLARHYAVFVAIPGLIAGALAFAGAEIFAQSYGEIGLTDYEPLHAVFSLPVSIGVLGIVVPTLLYALAAALTTRKLMLSDTVDMLSGKAGEKSALRTSLRESRISFKRKYAVRSLLGSPMRAFAVTLGITLGAMVLLFFWAMLDSVNYVAGENISGLGTFEYEYILNSLHTEVPDEGAMMLVSSMECEDGSTITFMGIDEENTYLSLVTTDGEVIAEAANAGSGALDGSFYVSTAAEASLGITAGDTVTFYNPLSLEEITITITGVIDYDMSSAIFTSLDDMADLLGVDAGSYNAIMSDTELEFADGEVRSTIRRSALIEQCETILTQMGPIIYLGLFIGVIVCIVAIYSVVNMLVRENRSSISMLKVLGYQDREINRIILSSYHVLLPIGIAIGIVAGFACLGFMWAVLLDYGVMLIRTHIEPLTYAAVILVVAACYFISLALAGRSTRRVSMEESLKDNRE